MLADKDAHGIIHPLINVIDDWYPVTLTGPRGRSGQDLAQLLRAAGARVQVVADLVNAGQIAQTTARPGDRIVVLGSFQTVAPVLAAQPWQSNSPPPSREA